jgi:hypothetical protein
VLDKFNPFYTFRRQFVKHMPYIFIMEKKKRVKQIIKITVFFVALSVGIHYVYPFLKKLVFSAFS